MIRIFFTAMLLVAPALGWAQSYPAPREGSHVLRDFRFHTGEVMAELRMRYVTIGNPEGEKVLILHGTNGSSASMLTPAFAGVLFGPGQALDASRYFLIIPDSLGAGGSSKPSDGLRAKFPRYNYDDMVAAQYRLLTEGLGVRHLRLVIGNSMGGMHAWIWGTTYPGFMDTLVPMAAQPTEMSSRNWMLRRMMIDAVRNDPAWKNGDYTDQPPALRIASVFYGVATSGGTLALQAAAPTREKADALLDARLGAPFRADANNALYQWDSSRDYNPAPKLDLITARVLVINSADDERNPPETGLLDRAMEKVRDGRVLLIPASADTRGHGTTANARFWEGALRSLLAEAPKRSM